VQVHGGIGITQELAVGHYFKRATLIENQFGSVDFHLSRFEALTLAA
jgi:alkylation response protein AidB-like acyl-CoA dehydrogenase